MCLPNFLVIGAPRSGTTTLHYSLGRHPEIFVSPMKETNFFLFDNSDRLPSWIDDATRRVIPKTLHGYEALFAQATSRHRAIGESSPTYLHGPVARRIKNHLPDAKLIAILRHPVEQAYSIYATWQCGSVADQPIDHFIDALSNHEPGPLGVAPLAEYGQFHRHISPFFDQFDRSQIKVVLLEDLRRDSVAFFADLFRFLGVDDQIRLDDVPRYNTSGAARSAAVHCALGALGSMRLKILARATLPEATIRHLTILKHRVRSANLRRNAKLTPNLRRHLTERFYQADILALGALVGRDLDSWLA